MNFVKGASRKPQGGVLSFPEIEKRRLELGISIDALCAEARISARGYYNIAGGAVTPRRLTRSKLTKALGRLTKEGLAP